jgi:hypothetical protein
MQDVVGSAIVARIALAHALLLQATEPLDARDFSRRFGATAPPIGWHLWHVARWADRVQASLRRANDPTNYQPNPNNGLWEQESLAAEWDLDPSTLGTLEEGSGMDHEDAAALAVQVGQAKIVEYATRAFAQLDDALQTLEADQFGDTRTSVMEFEIRNGALRKAHGKETTLAADLMFHLSHVNRHLGMIEALRGLLDADGSITV